MFNSDCVGIFTDYLSTNIEFVHTVINLKSLYTIKYILTLIFIVLLCAEKIMFSLNIGKFDHTK